MRQCTLEADELKQWREPKGAWHDSKAPAAKASAAVIYVKFPAEPPIEKVFRSLAGRWESETAHISSVNDAVLHPNYQRIIGMGERALPLILKRMKKNPGHWFWALSAITGENPVPQGLTGNLVAMSNYWLAWGQRKGLID